MGEPSLFAQLAGILALYSLPLLAYMALRIFTTTTESTPYFHPERPTDDESR